MKSTTLPALGLALFSSVTATSDDQFDPANYDPATVITRDVAVIGGGASGTYGAVYLKEMGQSVVLIERDSKLGGHVNTYYDPSNGISVDYGVQVYWNVSVTRDYFDLLGVDYANFSVPPTTTVFADFETGEELDLMPSSNYTAYRAQLDQYPYLEYSWDLPDPIPEDLLLPFSDFVEKYDLQDIVYSVYAGGSGLSHILSQLTINVFKHVDESYLSAISGSAVVPADYNNSEIYSLAADYLDRSNILLSSTVAAAQRPDNGSDASGVSLVVQGPDCKKLIQANKLFISIPPTLDNLDPFYDIDDHERSLFSRWEYSAYYALLINNTGLPDGTNFQNANSSTATYNIPQLPAAYQFSLTRDPGYYYVWYAGDEPLTQAYIEADVVATVKTLQTTLNVTDAPEPNVVAYHSHTPFELVVSAEALQDRFYDDLEALQGYRDTWWTGAAFISHDGPVLWNYTQNLLPELIAG